jgi:thioredoxin 1
MAKGTHVVHVDEDNFEKEVMQSEKPVLIDFGGVWCGPCKVLAPIVERLASDHAETLKVVTVDVDDSPKIAQRFGVRGVPTIVAIARGKERGRHVGLTSKETLLALVKDA